MIGAALELLWLTQLHLIAVESALRRLGYRYQPAIYGSVLFAQDEWVKS